jgi:hypothetical protein
MQKGRRVVIGAGGEGRRVVIGAGGEGRRVVIGAGGGWEKSCDWCRRRVGEELCLVQ